MAARVFFVAEKAEDEVKNCERKQSGRVSAYFLRMKTRIKMKTGESWNWRNKVWTIYHGNIAHFPLFSLFIPIPTRVMYYVTGCYSWLCSV